MTVKNAEARDTSSARVVDVEGRIERSDMIAPRSLAERLRLPLMVGVPVAVVIGTLVMYYSGGRYEATDDAYVQAARVQVSSNIPGRVVQVAVHENQLVKQGEVLFRLDPEPLNTAVAQSGAEAVPALLAQGVRHVRVELLDEDDVAIGDVIAAYRDLLAGVTTGRDVWTALKAMNRVGVTRGTLEEKKNPLAIL